MAKQVIQKKGGCLPTEQQLRLLKAALFKPELALDYWKEWLKNEGYNSGMLTDKNFLAAFFDPMDMGSERLIPLIQKNLSATDDPFIKALLGNRRKVWVQNQYHMAKAKKIIEIFSANQVPLYFPKGLPISIVYYDDVSVRVSADLDLLVAKEDMAKAAALLQAPPLSQKIMQRDLLYTDTENAIHFYDANSRTIDLHWCIFHEHGNNELLNSLSFNHTEPFYINGTETRTLNVNLLLYVAIAHGRHYNKVPPVRWVADACMIYQKRQEDINWKQIAEWALAFKHMYFFRQALPLLKGHFIKEIPDEVIAYVQGYKVSRQEKIYFSIMQNGKDRLRYFWIQPFKIYAYFNLFERSPNKAPFMIYLMKRFFKNIRYHLMPAKITE